MQCEMARNNCQMKNALLAISLFLMVLMVGGCGSSRYHASGRTVIQNIGSDTMVSGHVVLSAGWGPNHRGLHDRVIVIGDRCLIGRGSCITGHRLIEIGNDVWTGHHVYITDQNHGYEDLDTPISMQNQPEEPVRIGDGSWIGHNVVVLPGVTIGRHVVVGAVMGFTEVTTLSTGQILAIWIPMTIILALAMIRPIKGAIVGLQWALYMHGFGGTDDVIESHPEA